LLFISMLVRRQSARGQSMYVAITKFLGTLFAWLATALTVTTSVHQPWPHSVGSFFSDSVLHRDYPLTPLINYLYLVIFFVDLLYIVMLYRRLRSAGLRPWRHF
jgi:hypothetical protein